MVGPASTDWAPASARCGSAGTTPSAALTAAAAEPKKGRLGNPGTPTVGLADSGLAENPRWARRDRTTGAPPPRPGEADKHQQVPEES